MSLELRVKQEPEWDEVCGVSEAAARAGLYEGHHVKDELVVGPELLQSKDSTYGASVAVNKSKTCKEEPVSDGLFELRDCFVTLERIAIDNMRKSKTRNQETMVSDGLSELRDCFVKLERITNNNVNVSKTCKKESMVSDGSFEFRDCFVLLERNTIENVILYDSSLARLYTHVEDDKPRKTKEEISVTIKDKKLHSCDICNKQYSLRSSLLDHIKAIHTEKCYKCNLCKKKFATKKYLTKHKLIHENRCLTCEKCDKKFSSKQSLKQHNRVHVENMPFSCDICNKKFLWKHNMESQT